MDELPKKTRQLEKKYPFDLATKKTKHSKSCTNSNIQANVVGGAMNIKDLKQYLNTFSSTDGLGIIITNPSERSYYPITAIHLLSDLPCICIEVGKSLNLDEENLKHVTLDDQMQVTDFI